jgi:hypothetical protein
MFMFAKNKRLWFAGIIIVACFIFAWAQDPEYKELNIYTGNLDATRSDVGINGQWLRLDTTNDPLTGNLQIQKVDPEDRLTDTGDSNSTWIIRSDANAVAQRVNTVMQSGVLGNALDIAVNQYINIPDDDDFSIDETNKFTVAMWVNVNDVIGLKDPVIKGSSGDLEWGMRILNDTVICFVLQSSGASHLQVISGSLITAGQWHHIAMTIDMDAPELILYVDGSSVGNDTTTTGTLGPNAGGDVRIGTRVGGAVDFPGKVDEAAFWGRTLSANDISDLWDSGDGTFINKDTNFPTDGGSMGTNLIALYHLDETGMNQAPGGTDAEDSSVNTNHGTAEGTMVDGDFVPGKIITEGSDQDVVVWKSEDGGVGEKGIQTFSDCDGRTILCGKTLRFNIGGTEEANFDVNGTFTIDNVSAASQQLILRAAPSASENIFEAQDSSENILTQIDKNGGMIINEQGNDTDTRIEGSSDENLLFLDAGTNVVRIGTATGSAKLNVHNESDDVFLVVTTNKSNGEVDIGMTNDARRWDLMVNSSDSFIIRDGSGGPADIIEIEPGVPAASFRITTTSTIFNERSNDVDFRIEGDTDINLFRVNAGTDRVGISTSNPDAMLEIDINSNTEEGLKVKGAAAQSGDLIIATDDSDNIGFKIEADFDAVIGSGAAGKDYSLTFNGETNDGVLTWMEDEDYFKFSDEILMDSAEKINLRDTSIGIYSQADTFLDLFADGAVRIGNSSAGAPTTYVEIEPDADMTFVGSGSGLPYGNMFIPAGGIIVTIAASATPTEVDDAASPTWTGGQTNNTTFSDHNLSVGKTGRYSMSWSMSVSLATVGGNIEIHGGIMVDSVAVRDDGEGHRTITGANQSGHISGMTIQNLTANQEISLWISNATNTNNITVDHGNVVITLIGG